MRIANVVRIQQLEEQESAIFARRNEAEGEVNKIVGRELSPLEFLQIRQAISTFEDCEERIENVQARMNLAKAGH